MREDGRMHAFDAPDAPALISFDASELGDGLRRAVEVAAMAVAPLVGTGDKIAIDAAAVTALRTALAGLAVDGRIVAGEGEKDDAPMLEPGECFGTGGIAIDVAVDPVDGTTHAARGHAGALTVLAVAPRDAFIDIGPAHYLEKLVTWLPNALDDDVAIDAALITSLITSIAEVRGVPREQVRVAVQRRARNEWYADAATDAGAVVEFFDDGDVERSLRVLARECDLLVGIGGAPEGVLTAAAVRAAKGSMIARYAPQNAAEAARLVASGRNGVQCIGLDQLCTGPAQLVFAAITECTIDVQMPGVDIVGAATWQIHPDGTTAARIPTLG